DYAASSVLSVFHPAALPPLASPLFPSTTLFRSAVDQVEHAVAAEHVLVPAAGPQRVREHADLDLPCPQLPEHCDPLLVSERVRRSEEHTSELQSLTNLVCRLLLEKKKTPIRSST